MTTAAWIAIALLTPFWWGLGLFILAWFGDVSPRVLEKLNAEVNKVIGSEETKAAWLKQGTIAMGMSIDQFDRFLRDEIVKWCKIVRASGAKVD